MGKDSAARIELGRSFHQVGTVNEKVSESDFVPVPFFFPRKGQPSVQRILLGIPHFFFFFWGVFSQRITR